MNMKLSFFICIIFCCLIHLLNGKINQKQFWVSCRGVPLKHPGTIRFHAGEILPRTQPDLTLVNKTAVECYNSCIEDIDCQTAQLRTNSTWVNTGRCELYYQYKNIQVNMPGYPIMRWRNCNFKDKNKCVSINDRRCRGMWVAYTNYKGLQSNHKYQMKQNFSSLNEAMHECLHSIYCGSITYKSLDRVYLNVKWPDIKMKQVEGWKTYVWQCCDLEEEFDDDCCKLGNCTHYWSISGRGIKLDKKNGRYTAMFQSLSSYHCRLECVRQEGCLRPLFNKTNSVCVLEAKPNGCREHNIFFPNDSLTYKSYKRIACPNRNKILVENSTDDSCLCIHNVTGVKLFSDYCQQPRVNLTERKLYKNMAFYNKRKVTKIRGISYFYISTGLENLWLSLEAGDFKTNLHYCKYDRCQLHDASIPKQKHKIISRNMWGSQTTDKNAPKFKTTPQFVIIGRSITPLCSCYTVSSCSANCRLRQEFYVNQNNDSGLPENFIAGSYGRIYEGRGWLYFNNKISVDYQGNAIAISFVGDTDKYEPSLKSVNAVKWLISEGVRLGYIAYPYILLGYRDVSANINQPGENVYRIIQNWEGYKNNTLYNIPCPYIIIYWPFIILILLLLTCILLLILQKRDYFHRRACRVVRSKRSYITSDYKIKLYPVLNCLKSEFEDVLPGNIEIIDNNELSSNDNCNTSDYYAIPRYAVVFCESNMMNSLNEIIHSLNFTLQGVKESVLPHISFTENAVHIVREYLRSRNCQKSTFLIQLQPANLAESDSIVLLFHGNYSVRHLVRLCQSPKCLCPPYRYETILVSLHANKYDVINISMEIKSMQTCESDQIRELERYRSHHEIQLTNDGPISYAAFINSPWMWKDKQQKLTTCESLVFDDTIDK